MPHAAVIANGEICDLIWTANQIARFSFLAAVDGGLNYCQKMQLIPNLVIGDLDSILPEVVQEYSSLPFIKFPPLKDETDLALAIQTLLKQGFESIVIFGGVGKQLDHTLSNIHLMCRYQKHVKMMSEYETVFFLEKKHILQTSQGQRISLIPFNGPVSKCLNRWFRVEHSPKKT